MDLDSHNREGFMSTNDTVHYLRSHEHRFYKPCRRLVKECYHFRLYYINRLHFFKWHHKSSFVDGNPSIFVSDFQNTGLKDVLFNHMRVNWEFQLRTHWHGRQNCSSANLAISCNRFILSVFYWLFYWFAQFVEYLEVFCCYSVFVFVCFSTPGKNICGIIIFLIIYTL